MALAIVVGLTTILSTVRTNITVAAERAVWFQELEKLKASRKAGARWIREEECYALQIWLYEPIASSEQSEVQSPTTAQQHEERGKYFLENPDIANTRVLNPFSSYCTGLPTAGSSPPNVVKNPRAEVWLINSDGTQTSPADNRCEERCNLDVLYRYTAEDGNKATAVAIRIDDEFYIEKLPPLDRKPDMTIRQLVN